MSVNKYEREPVDAASGLDERVMNETESESEKLNVSHFLPQSSDFDHNQPPRQKNLFGARP